VLRFSYVDLVLLFTCLEKQSTFNEDFLEEDSDEERAPKKSNARNYNVNEDKILAAKKGV
jgi:hypothetical protein